MPDHLQDPKRRAMTPDEVLGLFRQWSMIEHWFTLDEVKARLGRDASISKLRAEIDYLGNWKALGESLNTIFDIDLPAAAWASYLRRKRRCTVGDLSDFIARHALIEEVQPAEILGRTCLEAGVFRTIVSMLKRAGADTSNLAPSTRVRPYIRDYSEVFFWDLGKIALGAMPKFEGMERDRIEHSGWEVLLWLCVGIFVSAALTGLASLLWSPLLPIAGYLMVSWCVGPVILIVGSWFGSSQPKPDDSRTFRHLCYVIADTMRAATTNTHPDPLREAASGVN